MAILAVRQQLLIYTTLLSSLSFFCLFSPAKILKQGTLLLIGDAMELRHYPYTAHSLAPAGFVLAVLALIYLTIYIRNDMGFLNAITSLRFLGAALICGWSYFSNKPPIGNSLIFSFAFGDLIFQVKPPVSHRDAD